jgi:hypothetical protein
MFHKFWAGRRTHDLDIDDRRWQLWVIGLKSQFVPGLGIVRLRKVERRQRDDGGYEFRRLLDRIDMQMWTDSL